MEDNRKMKGKLNQDYSEKFTQNKNKRFSSFKCTEEDCKKGFATVVGLNNHLKQFHPGSEAKQKTRHYCPYCRTYVLFFDQHLTKLHEGLQKTGNVRCVKR